MSKRVTKEQRHAIVQRYLNGEAVATISRETTIPRSTLYLWIRKARINPSKKVQLRDLSRLKMHTKGRNVLLKYYKPLLVLRHRLFGKNLTLLF